MIYHQPSLWSEVLPTKKITKPVRLIELFAGDYTNYAEGKTKKEILKRINGVSTNYNEPVKNLDKRPLAWLQNVYNNVVATKNLVNIMNVTGEDLEVVETDKYEYVMTYSFPCQDLSLAGKGKGMAKDSDTRSGLLWEVERLLDELKEKPQILIMENVPQVIGKNNIKHFQKWRAKLESLGYSNYVELLNAKDYGIPQNRNRCFMVSILGDYAYEFPIKMKLKYRLKDFLEAEVDEKYYLSDRAIKGMLNTKFEQGKLENKMEKNGIIPSILARDYKDPKVVFDRADRFRSVLKLTNEKGLSACIKTRQRSSVTESYVIESDHSVEDVMKETENKNLKEKYCNELISKGLVKEGDVVKHSYTNNRIQKNKERIENKDGLSPTLDTRCDCLGVTVLDSLPIKEATKKGYKIATEGDGADISGRMATHRGTVQKGLAQTLKTSIDVSVVVKLVGGVGEKKSNKGTQYYNQNRIYDSDGIATAIPTDFHPNYTSGLRIRKLTPKECMWLMGFEDKDVQPLSLSDSQIYCIAGNSIVTTVLVAIFSKLYGIDYRPIAQKYIDSIQFLADYTEEAK